MIFFNVGWMNQYQGEPGIRGGGAWVGKHGVGHEMYNFAPVRGVLYGSVQPPGGREINISRLGAAANDAFVDDVTVVWVAKDPKAGLRVIGWYRRARVFRFWQPPPPGAKRAVRSKRDQAHYLVSAKEHDCHLLDRESRTFPIPRNRVGAMGQANVWFAESPLGRATIRKVETFMRAVAATGRRGKRVPARVDVDRKVAVELAAIRAVTAYYTAQGFRVRDIQRDNAGWDLEATRRRETLLVEVKGLSGSEPCADLTPNEFHHMQRRSKAYRLCIVTHALDPRKQTMRRFECSNGRDWIDQHDCLLEVKPITGARVRLA
jgi:hypothetical protein